MVILPLGRRRYQLVLDMPPRVEGLAGSCGYLRIGGFRHWVCIPHRSRVFRWRLRMELDQRELDALMDAVISGPKPFPVGLDGVAGGRSYFWARVERRARWRWRIALFTRWFIDTVRLDWLLAVLCVGLVGVALAILLRRSPTWAIVWLLLIAAAVALGALAIRLLQRGQNALLAGVSSMILGLSGLAGLTLHGGVHPTFSPEVKVGPPSLSFSWTPSLTFRWGGAGGGDTDTRSDRRALQLSDIHLQLIRLGPVEAGPRKQLSTILRVMRREREITQELLAVLKEMKDTDT